MLGHREKPEERISMLPETIKSSRLNSMSITETKGFYTQRKSSLEPINNELQDYTSRFIDKLEKSS